MRICKFEIQNFKGIQKAAFEWDDIVVLIGENNAFKSTVLQALQWFLSGSQLKDEAYFCENLDDIDHAIEVTGHFCQLSDIEQQSGAVRGRMIADKWILKKKFWCERRDGEEPTWKEQYYSYCPDEAFTNWPANDNAWGSFPQEYQSLITQIDGRGARPNSQTREQLRELARQQKPELLAHGKPSCVP